MLLAYKEICKLLADGIVQNADPELVNGTSLDITLGNSIKYEVMIHREISLRERTPVSMNTFLMNDDGYLLKPGEFILGCSAQVFNLPLWLSADLKLKSSVARIGITNLLAGWCDPGWNGSVLTLELQNCTHSHSIRIRPGDRIGQVVFFSHAMVPEGSGYGKRGRYNNDKQVQGIKL